MTNADCCFNSQSRAFWPAFARAFLVALFFTGAAWASQTEINLLGKRVEIYFHPPLRTGPQDPHPFQTEIPRLNLIFNHLENYLIYLTKLEKIPENLKLSIHYYPDGSDEFQGTSDQIMVQDLGWNSLLIQVNGKLRRLAGGVKRYLIDNVNSLLQIRDQLGRSTDSFEARMNFTNLSSFLERLEPESDFILSGPDAAISIRPGESQNLLAFLTLSGSGSILLPEGKSSYSKLRCSADGAYLAFAEGGNPKILNVASHEVIPLFPSETKILLDLEWAPIGSLAAGIVLDRRTSSRDIFIYDAVKKEFLNFFTGNDAFNGDYQFAYPYWAPNGKRLFFTTGSDITLLDISTRKSYPGIVKTKTSMTIAEIVWSDDSQSFAYVDVEGKSRSKAEFIATDMRGWSLHRCNLTPTCKVIEDPAQSYTSKEALKLVGFWTLDRVLFLEGNLHTPRIVTSVVDLTGVLAARLTPSPSLVRIDQNPAAGAIIPAGFMDLPMKYCYVFKNLDGKFKNVYDSGYGHTHQIFIDEMVSIWFLGLRLPEGIPGRKAGFSLMTSPYPYPERNFTICKDYPQNRISALVDMIKSYNLRRFDIAEDLDRFFFLSNGRGPLTLWTGKIQELEKVERPADNGPEESETPGSEAGSEPSGELPSDLPGGAMPFPGSDLPGGALPLPSLPTPETTAPSVVPATPTGAGGAASTADPPGPAPAPASALPSALPGGAFSLPPASNVASDSRSDEDSQE